MRRLVIDTATSACSVALFDGDELLADRFEIIGRGHAECLIPMISDLPKQGRANAIHVNVGPGSFTGIRVGVAAARALALAWLAECHGYGCLDLVAAIAAHMHSPEEKFAVAMVGGHGEYYVQRFESNGLPSDPSPVSMPVERALAELQSCRLFMGDAAERFVEQHGQGCAKSILPNSKFWTLLGVESNLPPSPFYVRGPDAKQPVGKGR